MNYDKIYKYTLWIIGIVLGIAVIKLIIEQSVTNPWFILQLLGVGVIVYYSKVMGKKKPKKINGGKNEPKRIYRRIKNSIK